MENPSLPHYHGEEPAHTEVVRQMLEKEDTFQELSDIFRQLGDANRIRIFWLLCHCEECVVNIAAMMDMSSPAVSHHLRILRDSGLLTSLPSRRLTSRPLSVRERRWCDTAGLDISSMAARLMTQAS